MANGILLGVNSVARRVIGGYIGVENIARTILKGYIGVDGVAEQFFQAGTSDEEFTFTSTQSWTVPAGARNIDIFVVGGGGAAGGSFELISGHLDYNQTYRTTRVYGPSGGSGYTNTVSAVAVTAGETLTVVVGAGGTGGKSYVNNNGTYTGDVSSISNMTNGSSGGESYVARGSTKLASANGGAGGAKANLTSSGAGYFNGTTGANGGNGSGAGGSNFENLVINSQGGADSDITYFYCAHGNDSRANRYGTDGTNGGSGGAVDYWAGDKLADRYTKMTDSAFSGGTGQGHNTRKYGQSGETVYATVGTEVSANTGNSGKLGLTAYTNKNGSSGVVIIMVHY